VKDEIIIESPRVAAVLNVTEKFATCIGKWNRMRERLPILTTIVGIVKEEPWDEKKKKSV
jgi:hypothetical protein